MTRIAKATTDSGVRSVVAQQEAETLAMSSRLHFEIVADANQKNRSAHQLNRQ